MSCKYQNFWSQVSLLKKNANCLLVYWIYWVGNLQHKQFCVTKKVPAPKFLSSLLNPPNPSWAFQLTFLVAHSLLLLVGHANTHEHTHPTTKDSNQTNNAWRIVCLTTTATDKTQTLLLKVKEYLIKVISLSDIGIKINLIFLKAFKGTNKNEI